MRFSPVFLLLPAIAVALTFCSCTDEPGPVAPPDTTKPPPPRDTTSHEFTWELYKIGDTYGRMEDVWAVSDDYAIAVGRFTGRDSTGSQHPDSLKNVAAIVEAELHVSLVTTDEGLRPILSSCFATSESNMWVANSFLFVKQPNGYVLLGDESLPFPEWGGIITKMWGRKNTEDIYLTAGNVIQRYKDGQVKTIVKPEDHPGIAFYDIWGEENGDVVALGNDYSRLTCFVYLIKPDNSWEVIHQSPAVLDGIWGYQGTWYFGDWGSLMAWDGKNFRTVTFNLGNPYRVRGNHENDIFVTYQNCHVLHWNGSTWEDIYHDEYPGITATGASVSEHTVYLCGIMQPGQQPVILVGKRQ